MHVDDAVSAMPNVLITAQSMLRVSAQEPTVKAGAFSLDDQS